MYAELRIPITRLVQFYESMPELQLHGVHLFDFCGRMKTLGYMTFGNSPFEYFRWTKAPPSREAIFAALDINDECYPTFPQSHPAPLTFRRKQ
jgi:hypothetical protein